MNKALVQWLSNNQYMIQTSVFGAEFVVIKIGMETLRGLRYKLRMMGIPLSDQSLIYGDNMSVIHNKQRPEYTLGKKRNSICYHAIRQSFSMGESMTAWVPTGENTADSFTKVLYGSKQRHIVGNVMRDIYDEHQKLNSILGRPFRTLHSGAQLCKVKSASSLRRLEIGGIKSSQTTYLIVKEAWGQVLRTGSHLYGE